MSRQKVNSQAPRFTDPLAPKLIPGTDFYEPADGDVIQDDPRCFESCPDWVMAYKMSLDVTSRPGNAVDEMRKPVVCMPEPCSEFTPAGSTDSCEMNAEGSACECSIQRKKIRSVKDLMNVKKPNEKRNIKNSKYVSVNQLCDVLEDFIQRNKDIDSDLNNAYLYYIQFDSNKVYDDNYDKNKFIIKPTLISLWKHEQLKEADILKLFKCKKLYLKVPKNSRHHYIHKWASTKSYILIDRATIDFTKDGKELKYHGIQNCKDSDGNDDFNEFIQTEIDFRLENDYDRFIKNVIL